VAENVNHPRHQMIVRRSATSRSNARRITPRRTRRAQHHVRRKHRGSDRASPISSAIAPGKRVGKPWSDPGFLVDAQTLSAPWLMRMTLGVPEASLGGASSGGSTKRSGRDVCLIRAGSVERRWNLGRRNPERRVSTQAQSPSYITHMSNLTRSCDSVSSRNRLQTIGAGDFRTHFQRPKRRTCSVRVLMGSQVGATEICERIAVP
jgi:hypothetical protein